MVNDSGRSKEENDDIQIVLLALGECNHGRDERISYLTRVGV